MTLKHVNGQFRLFACYVQQRNGGAITTIVMFKSKCGILHGMIIWLIVFVWNEMKVMKNNNVVLVTHWDPGHRNCDFGHKDTGCKNRSRKIQVIRLRSEGFWSEQL